MEVKDRHYILGTAGHIDHGKTSLVKALTGVETDRLKEEQQRGLTIDIGFARYGKNATIIDVPGHEKFIKNMVAGVSTIDLVLFIVAADDGVMPQTREHLDILNILHIHSGIIVITKKDLVDEEWLALVQDDVAELTKGTLLAQAPQVAVCSHSGDGIDQLRQLIRQKLAALPNRQDRGVFWQPVDRSFTMKGFGTVVTGSILSGQVRTGDLVEILPQAKIVRIRGLQKHGQTHETAQTGDRAAINIQGFPKDEVGRGDVLTSPGFFSATRRIHAKLRLLNNKIPIKPNTRVRLHIGTSEIIARATPIGLSKLEPGQEGYVQIHLEKSAATRRLEPFVLRQYSPSNTIGGGLVLDANAKVWRRRDKGLLEKLKALEHNDPTELIAQQLLLTPDGVMSIDELVSKTGTAAASIRDDLQAMEKSGQVIPVSKKQVAHTLVVARLQRAITDALQAFHVEEPWLAGLPRAELPQKLEQRWARQFLQKATSILQETGEIREVDGLLALAQHQIVLPAEMVALKEKVEICLQKAGFSPPSLQELVDSLQAKQHEIEALINVLITEKKVIRLDSSVFLLTATIATAHGRLQHHFSSHDTLTIARFKDYIDGASRKYAMPLINYFDAQEITFRDGDVRRAGPEIGLPAENDK